MSSYTSLTNSSHSFSSASPITPKEHYLPLRPLPQFPWTPEADAPISQNALTQRILPRTSFDGFDRGVRKLHITNSEWDNEQLYRLLAKCQKVTEIKLEKLPKVSFEQCDSLGAMPLVKVLDLHEIGITDIGLLALSKLFPNLQVLHIANCSQLTGAGFSFVTLPRKLKALSLPKSPISGTALQNLLRKFTQLQTLLLTECRSITKEEFKAMNWPRSLRKLDLQHTAIDQEGLLRFFNTSATSKEYDTRGCSNLSSLWQTVVTFPEDERPTLSHSSGEVKTLEEEIFKMEL